MHACVHGVCVCVCVCVCVHVCVWKREGERGDESYYHRATYIKITLAEQDGGTVIYYLPMLCWKNSEQISRAVYELISRAVYNQISRAVYNQISRAVCKLISRAAYQCCVGRTQSIVHC